MAVPKKKKSSSRSSMRRGSNGTFDADFANVIVDKSSGDFKLSHHISPDGTYNGKQVIKKKNTNTSGNEEKNKKTSNSEKKTAKKKITKKKNKKTSQE